MLINRKLIKHGETNDAFLYNFHRVHVVVSKGKVR